MDIKILPALSDNYIYLIEVGADAFVVDPSEADKLLPRLTAAEQRLVGILITHRHTDHIGGLAALREAYPDAVVYAPNGCGINGAKVVCAEETVEVFGNAMQVIATPGHTLEHIAYVGEGFMFSGDTLFIGGCGRVFEGTMQQMHDSLAALATYPDNIAIYCGHEYTRANLAFAQAVEPDNDDIKRQLAAAQNIPTVPGTLAMERKTNPFLRLNVPAVRAAAEQQAGRALASSVAVFAALREWKNNF